MNGDLALYCRMALPRENAVCEHNNLTNALLLSILALILFVSGSLQYAFDCLTQVNNPSLVQQVRYFETVRVDDCHPGSSEQHITGNYCQHKICHQHSMPLSDLGTPEILPLFKQAHPLYSDYRQPQPDYRAGSPLPQSHRPNQSKLQRQTATASIPTQSLSQLRSTVLLC